MIREELIEALEEILACYKIAHDEDSPTNKEIGMWRQRFLVENLTAQELEGDIPKYFLSTPSQFFIRISPHEHVEQIKSYIKIYPQYRTK